MIIFSIVIPTYNASLLIARTIDSIINQKEIDLATVEILIVDDCSTDDTLTVVESLDCQQIKSLRQERNQGPAAARNRGLREAHGKYAAFLDADDYWEPEFLHRTVDFLERHPKAVAVSVGQIHKIIGRPDTVMPQSLLKDADLLTEPVLLDDFFRFWADHNHVCTGSVLMRTDIARVIGGQREDLRICEDLEFWALLATQGPWGFIPEVLFVSDGAVATIKQGWLEKNQRRWASAVTVEEWNHRFRSRVSASSLGGYLRAEGRIARNICYSMIMSDRNVAARQTVLDYGCNFPGDRMSRLMQGASKNRLLWSALAALLRFREFHRKIT